MGEGFVRDGSAAAQQPVAGGTVTALAVGPMDNNAYLIECSETGARCLVDAAADAGALLGLVSRGSGEHRLDCVVTTHLHADHWQALDEVVRTTGARTHSGRADAHGIPVPTDRPLDDGDDLSVGSLRVEVIHLVGHTPGSIALLLGEHTDSPLLITGDSLFPGGVGRTWSPEDFASLIDDVSTKVFDRLPDSTRVLPGHGDPTTLRAERPHLPEWRARGW